MLVCECSIFVLFNNSDMKESKMKPRKTKLAGLGKRIGYYCAARYLKNRGYSLEQVLSLLYAGTL
jgi:hypothetical protein